MADNENWASFPPTNSAKEEEDDWADFGGFETAQPITDPQATAAAGHGLISWAAMPTTPQIASINSAGVSQSPGGFHDNVQQRNPWTTMVTTPGQQTTTNVEVEQLAGVVSASPSLTQLDDPVKKAGVTEISDTSEMPNKDINGSQSSDYLKKLKEHQEKTEKAEHLINDLENKLAAAEQEKTNFKKELEDLINTNKHLEEESNATKQALEEQKLKYSHLQEKHDKQITEIRQAGHDALAIIIEEYKELSKNVVLEQKEKCQADLGLFLENERQNFKETLIQQQESFEKTLSEERTNNDERIKSVLQAEQEKHKLLLESSLKTAQEESKIAMQIAIKETVEKGQESVKEAVAKEKESHLKAMEDMEKLLQEEREKFKMCLQETINEEQKQNKIAIREALVEERSKSKDALNKSIEETKTIMNYYTQQKLEAESKIHQKQFMAIDLFLDSARSQLKSLMDKPSTS